MDLSVGFSCFRFFVNIIEPLLQFLFIRLRSVLSLREPWRHGCRSAATGTHCSAEMLVFWAARVLKWFVTCKGKLRWNRYGSRWKRQNNLLSALKIKIGSIQKTVLHTEICRLICEALSLDFQPWFVEIYCLSCKHDSKWRANDPVKLRFMLDRGGLEAVVFSQTGALERILRA